MDEVTQLGRENVYPIIQSGEGAMIREWGITKREEIARSQMAALRSVFPESRSDELAEQACKDADALLCALSATPANAK